MNFELLKSTTLIQELRHVDEKFKMSHLKKIELTRKIKTSPIQLETFSVLNESITSTKCVRSDNQLNYFHQTGLSQRDKIWVAELSHNPLRPHRGRIASQQAVLAFQYYPYRAMSMEL